MWGIRGDEERKHDTTFQRRAATQDEEPAETEREEVRWATGAPRPDAPPGGESRRSGGASPGGVRLLRHGAGRRAGGGTGAAPGARVAAGATRGDRATGA